MAEVLVVTSKVKKLIKEKGQIRLCFDRLDLKGGKYFINIGVYEQNWAYAYDFHWHVYPLIIKSEIDSNPGILSPPLSWKTNSNFKIVNNSLQF